jgi:peptidoglycan/xylan/chitin deacetylase (PgdA/CDA1 family)
VLIGQGYVPIYWSLDTHDWQEQVTGKGVLSRVTSNVRRGDIILFHATTPKTADVLPQILAELEKKGFACGTVSSVLAP